MSVNKASLTDVVRYAVPGISKNESEQAVNVIIDEISNALSKGEEVEIRGLFSAKVVTSAPCQRRNPQTGKKVNVPAKKRVKIKVSKLLKDRVNAL